MAEGRDDRAFWGRLEVRAAIAAGYVLLFGLIFFGTEGDAGTSLNKVGAVNTAATSNVPVNVAEAAQSSSEAKSNPAADAAITALAKITDYQRAKWHPLHFKPDIDKATNAECLACHKEILDHKVREKSPAGVSAAQSIAWYQTLDTYEGAQESFHARHMTTPLAKKVMNLQCNFCHQGNDPREEAPHSNATTPEGKYTLRKMVDPVNTCLRCHGKFPGQNMGFDAGKWPDLREGIETPETPNGCLTCHADQFRTVRHQVNYLNAAAIEAEAKTNTDLCYGCHGGRQWYRTNFPYPRHAWPGMDPAVPDWAKDRPTESLPEHLAGMKK